MQAYTKQWSIEHLLSYALCQQVNKLTRGSFSAVQAACVLIGWSAATVG